MVSFILFFHEKHARNMLKANVSVSEQRSATTWTRVQTATRPCSNNLTEIGLYFKN